jgi:hypothetical protein
MSASAADVRLGRSLTRNGAVVNRSPTTALTLGCDTNRYPFGSPGGDRTDAERLTEARSPVASTRTEAAQQRARIHAGGAGGALCTQGSAQGGNTLSTAMTVRGPGGRQH